jgi:hypothetical protein
MANGFILGQSPEIKLKDLNFYANTRVLSRKDAAGNGFNLF